MTRSAAPRRLLRHFLSFDGGMGRLHYALSVPGLLGFQWLLVLVILLAFGVGPSEYAVVYLIISPWKILLEVAAHSYAAVAGVIAVMFIAAWSNAALAVKRSADAGTASWLAGLAIAPLLQIPVMIMLATAPGVPATGSGHDSVGAVGRSHPRWRPAIEGMLVGMGLTLFAVGVGALVFGTYGLGIFVFAPFVIGAITAWLANRDTDAGWAGTASLVSVALTLGAIALVMAALEGFLCILMAFPIAWPIALLGGMFGRACARWRKPSIIHSLAGFLLFPGVFALEQLAMTPGSFESRHLVEIDAPPEVVWKAITHMNRFAMTPGLPYRLGIAYPMGGEIDGQGIGATRRGVFSTGTSIERVTQWDPPHRLSVGVLSEPPAMIELSPYEKVHAPHVHGYFTTSAMSFRIVALDNGLTRLEERTTHRLRLEPLSYWLPLARWAVRQNNERVLDHVRRQAEVAALTASWAPMAKPHG